MPVSMRTTNSHSPLPSRENPAAVAQSLGLTLEQMESGFAIVLEYIGLQISLSRKRSIDAQVNQETLEILGDSKEQRKSRKRVRDLLREKMYIQLKLETWCPTAIERGSFVQPIYQALGSPLPGREITVSRELIRNVMVLLHSIAFRRLDELGMKILPLNLKIQAKNRKKLQTEWMERLISTFGCTCDMKYFATHRKRQKYHR